jgi:hypothetical protein
MENAGRDIGDALKIPHICDREGDNYELFGKALQSGRHFLIRIVPDRMTVENKEILDGIRKRRCQGRVEATLPRDSRGNVPERKTVLQARYASYAVKRPQILNKVRALPDSITMQVIYVREEKSAKGKSPTEWFLVTGGPVNSSKEAYEYAGYYIQRWKIERFHYVLKSGCAIEKLQERSIEKAVTLILMYSVIAVFIMNLTYIARIHPGLPCSLLLGEGEWKLL